MDDNFEAYDQPAITPFLLMGGMVALIFLGLIIYFLARQRTHHYSKQKLSGFEWLIKHYFPPLLKNLHLSSPDQQMALGQQALEAHNKAFHHSLSLGKTLNEQMKALKSALNPEKEVEIDDNEAALALQNGHGNKTIINIAVNQGNTGIADSGVPHPHKSKSGHSSAKESKSDAKLDQKTRIWFAAQKWFEAYQSKELVISRLKDAQTQLIKSRLWEAPKVVYYPHQGQA